MSPCNFLKLNLKKITQCASQIINFPALPWRLLTFMTVFLNISFKTLLSIYGLSYSVFVETKEVCIEENVNKT